MNIEGIVTALITPLKEDYQIDEQGLRAAIDRQIQAGLSGILMLGGTGEFAALTREQRVDAVRIAVAHTAGRVPVIAGVLAAGYQECVLHCKAFEEAGADILLVLTPYYISPSQEGMTGYFQRVDRAVHIPVMIYNIPYRTGVNILPETVEAIVKSTEHIRGIKECCPDFGQSAELLRRMDKSFTFMSGEEYLCLNVLPLGAKGGIIATCNVFPEFWAEAYDLVKAGNLPEAQRRFLDYLPLIKALFREANPGPIKYAMRKMGLPAGYPCAPIPREPTPATREQIDALLAEKHLI